MHTLHPHWDGGERPDTAYVKKFAPKRFGADAPDHSYGPGVDDSNTSALGGREE